MVCRCIIALEYVCLVSNSLGNLKCYIIIFGENDSDLTYLNGKILPSAIEKLVVLDPKTSRLMSKEFDDVVIATIYDLFDLREYLINKKVEEIEQESAVTEQ